MKSIVKTLILLFSCCCNIAYTTRLVVLQTPEKSSITECVSVKVFDIAYKDTTTLIVKKKVADVTPIHVYDTILVTKEYLQMLPHRK